MTINMTALWDALGWAILHSLWQGAAIGVLVWMVRALLTERRATSRYLVGMAGLVLTGVAFLGTFVWLTVSGATPVLSLSDTTQITTNPVVAAGELFVAIRALPSTGVQTDMAAAIVPFLGMIWLVGFAFLSIQAYRAWSHTRWLANHGLRSAGTEWTGRFESLIQKIHAPERVRLFISDHVAGPMTLGALRPIVLVPAGFLTGLPSAQVEAILLHELAHIRRHDFMFGLFQTAIRTVLYFNPAVWLMSRAVDADREQACDDMAVKVSGQAVDLVRGLAALRLHSAAPSLAMAADGGPLLTRLNRLMGRSSSTPLLRTASNRLSAAALSALMLGTAACTSVSMASPQPPEAPTAPDAKLPDTVVRSERNWQQPPAAPTAPQTPEVRVLAQAPDLNTPIPPVPAMPAMPAMPDLPPVPVVPVMPALPDVPVPLFSNYDSEDAFEEAMEAWGEKMEAWGETVEARFEGEWEAEMEAWGEEVEARFEGNWEVKMEAWGDEMEAWGEEMEALGETLEELQDLEDEELLALGLNRAQLDNRLRVIEQRAESEERRTEAEAERMEAEVERQMAQVERNMERAERKIERQQEGAERQIERQMHLAEREAEKAMREVERMVEREAALNASHSRMNHTVHISGDKDHDTIIMAGKTVDVAMLRTSLYKALQSDGLIRSDRSAASLVVTPDEISVNGRNVTESQRQRYLELISAAGLCPDDSLTIKLTSDATRIVLSRDGKDLSTTTVGTYDHDSK